jgi:hypothetical protein
LRKRIASGAFCRRFLSGGTLGFGPVDESAKVRGVWFESGSGAPMVAGNICQSLDAA